MHVPLPHSRAVRFAILGFVVAALVGLIIWRGPDLSLVGNAFDAVSWYWVALAVAINLFSVAVRASAWRIVLRQAIPRPWPRWRIVFSAFCVGLLGNVALPGRVGELARVAVVTRHLRRRPGTWATVVGTVFAHRMFDVIASVGLVVYVLYTARIPDWAKPALAIVIGVGLGLLLGLERLRHPLQHRERQPLVREEEQAHPDADGRLDRLQPDPVCKAVRIRDAVREEREGDRRL